MVGSNTGKCIVLKLFLLFTLIVWGMKLIFIKEKQKYCYVSNLKATIKACLLPTAELVPTEYQTSF